MLSFSSFHFTFQNLSFSLSRFSIFKIYYPIMVKFKSAISHNFLFTCLTWGKTFNLFVGSNLIHILLTNYFLLYIHTSDYAFYSISQLALRIFVHAPRYSLYCINDSGRKCPTGIYFFSFQHCLHFFVVVFFKLLFLNSHLKSSHWPKALAVQILISLKLHTTLSWDFRNVW